jgi:hypothetical protein
MASMTFQAQTGRPKSHGFVVAMRAKLINVPLPARFEWLIVSRWGSHLQHLSIGWTSQPAATDEAPMNLTPNKTSLAVLPDTTYAQNPATFHLAPALPGQVTVAGDFVPAEGLVHLYGVGTELRVRLKGQCLSCKVPNTWHVEATRAAWIGEFIEPGRA